MDGPDEISDESPWKGRIYIFIFFFISAFAMVGWLIGLFWIAGHVAYWLLS
jgi:hypothetical protein